MPKSRGGHFRTNDNSPSYSYCISTLSRAGLAIALFHLHVEPLCTKSTTLSQTIQGIPRCIAAIHNGG